MILKCFPNVILCGYEPCHSTSILLIELASCDCIDCMDRYARILCVTYESMTANLREVAVRVAQHLSLDVAEADIDHLLEFLTFKSMKSTKQFQPTSVSWKEGFQFVRKGVVGDFRSHFVGDMEERFCAAVRGSQVFTVFDPWGGSDSEEVRSLISRYMATAA